MARVPLIDPGNVPGLADFAARVRGRRRGRVINVYRMLAHSPPLAQSWFEHVNAVRWETEIDGRLREIVIIRLAHVSASPYVLRQHVPKLAEAEGLSAEACTALEDWRGSPLFDERERGALQKVAEAGAEVMAACVELGGALTGEHGVGLEKKEQMPLVFSPDDMNAMLRVRESFAPLNRLNPEKVFPGGFAHQPAAHRAGAGLFI